MFGSTSKSNVDSQRNVLGLDESVQALDSKFTSPAALFDPAEGALAGGGDIVINPDRSCFQRFHQAPRPAEVARKSICAEAVN